MFVHLLGASSLARDQVFVIVVMQTRMTTDVNAELKTAEKRRRIIEKPAPCFEIPESFLNGSAGPVVEFGKDVSFHCPGQKSSHYQDSRESCGAHLVFYVFCIISTFYVHQIPMHNQIHAIDFGIMITP